MNKTLAPGLVAGPDGKPRCFWQAGWDEYERYHDREWGMPQRDNFKIYEKVCLEGFQAGLSWLTILRKRENFRRAFSGFDYHKVAKFGANDVKRLLADAGIVRHRGKIEAAINNARCAISLEEEFGSLAAFFWQFEPQKRPARITKKALMAMTMTPESKQISKELKARGWRFVGPTTMYAFMQSIGLVNDHIEGCCRRDAVEAKRNTFRRPKFR